MGAKAISQLLGLEPGESPCRGLDEDSDSKALRAAPKIPRQRHCRRMAPIHSPLQMQGFPSVLSEAFPRPGKHIQVVIDVEHLVDIRVPRRPMKHPLLTAPR